MTRQNSQSSAELLKALKKAPKDSDLVEQAARALQREGEYEHCAKLLLATFTNLTAHETDPLPCLCKHCLDLKVGAINHDGDDYCRDFAIAHGRVLFFWIPAGLPVTSGLRTSIQQRMAQRLTKKRSR